MSHSLPPYFCLAFSPPPVETSQDSPSQSLLSFSLSSFFLFYQHLEQRARPSLHSRHRHGLSTHDSSIAASNRALSSSRVLSFRDEHIPVKEPPLISLSVIEACRECSRAYLCGADPINHSTLHHFRCVSAVHLLYSGDQRGRAPLLSQVSAVLGPCRTVNRQSRLPVISLFFHPSVSPLTLVFCVLSCLFSFHTEEALAASRLWHVLMLTELRLSENVTIAIIPHLHFFKLFFFFSRSGKWRPVSSLRRQWTVLLWFSVITVMRTPVVHCEKPGRKTGLTQLIKRARSEDVFVCRCECCGLCLAAEKKGKSCCGAWIVTVKNEQSAAFCLTQPGRIILTLFH